MKTAQRINLLLNLGAEHPYYSKGGTWFHVLKRFPAVLIDTGGYVYFETEEIYRNTPGINISKTSNNQVHVPGGIAELSGYQPFTEAESTSIFVNNAYPLSLIEAPTDEKALRVKREINALVRNKRLVQEIKRQYNHTCQLCGERMQVRPGKYYSEVHHIKPLGQKHDGADVKANMLCVCPNHHTMLDFFALRLDVDTLLFNKHPLSEAYVSYHNERFEKFNPELASGPHPKIVKATRPKQMPPVRVEKAPETFVIEESEKKEVSPRMVSFIQLEIGVPKPGHIRLMAPLTYDESVRLYNTVLEKFPGALWNTSGTAGREAVASAANDFLTKIDRIKKM